MSVWSGRRGAYKHCEATGKRSFLTEADARIELGNARRLRRISPTGKTENRYYHCAECGGFHLTHLSRAQITKEQGHE